jgi:predicted nucleotidyltransferase
MRAFDEDYHRLQNLNAELTKNYSFGSIGLFGLIFRDDFSADKIRIDILDELAKTIGIGFIDVTCFLELQLKRKVDLISRNRKMTSGRFTGSKLKMT